jgi:hypothetical protein
VPVPSALTLTRLRAQLDSEDRTANRSIHQQPNPCAEREVLQYPAAGFGLALGCCRAISVPSFLSGRNIVIAGRAFNWKSDSNEAMAEKRD